MASLYTHLSKRVEERIVDSAVRSWKKTLTCEHPDCRETHMYGTDDLRLYDD